MDFAFFAIFVVAIVAGFVGASLFALSGQPLSRGHWRKIVFWTVPAGFLLSVNWSRVTLADTGMLVVSFVFITLFGAIGVAIGMAPVAVITALSRGLKRQAVRASDDSA